MYFLRACVGLIILIFHDKLRWCRYIYFIWLWSPLRHIYHCNADLCTSSDSRLHAGLLAEKSAQKLCSAGITSEEDLQLPYCVRKKKCFRIRKRKTNEIILLPNLFLTEGYTILWKHLINFCCTSFIYAYG